MKTSPAQPNFFSSPTSDYAPRALVRVACSPSYFFLSFINFYLFLSCFTIFFLNFAVEAADV